MAARYWVGGTGIWDNLALLKWSTTSGGLGGSAVPTSADDVFFDANSGANTVTIGAGTAICDSLTMTGFTGTLAFGTNSIDLTGTGTTYTGATTFSVTGTPLILCTNSSATARTINAGAVTETNSISFDISAGSGVITTGTGQALRNFIFSGTFTGTLNNNTRTLYGNLTIKSGMTVNAGSNTTTFAATSGTQIITSAGLNLNFPITINAPNATVQLQDALLVGTATARNITLTSGTFDLNNNTVTIAAGAFIGSGSTARTLAFGTGQFYLSGTSGSIWSVSGTNLTITGTSPTVNATANATTGERTVVHVPTTVSQALSISLNVTAGSSQIGFGTGEQVFNNLNFTGFSGQIGNAGQSGNARFTIYGNLTMGAGMTCVGGASGHNFRGTGTQLITSNGVIFDQPIGLSGTGTYSLQDAFVTGSTRLITLTTGTLQTNGYSLTSGTFSFGGSGTKTLTFTNSTVTITGGSSTTGFTGSLTNTTLNLTGNVIVFTTAGTALLNAGGNGTVPAVTMGGTGQLIIGQSGTAPTVTTLSNTVSPCTISLLSTIGQLNVTNFNLSGTAGNLVTLNSSVAGTARTISKSSGTVNAYYLNIQDSTASGGAVWNAYDSTNSGNNTGWNFSTIFTGDVSEAFSILDIINVLSAFTTSATEPVTVADTLDTTAAFISNTTEPITLADTPSTTATFATVITENASFADITSSLAAFAAAIVEAANLADSSIGIRIHNSDLTEAITLDDSQTVVANFASVVFEDINIEDFPTVEASFLAVITEDTNLAAFQAVAATFAASLAEAITSADASIGIRIHNSDATEIITLDNAQTALRTQYALIVENLVPADAPIVIASFNSQITENLVLLDSPFPRGWYAINDGQTVTWTKVNNSYP